MEQRYFGVEVFILSKAIIYRDEFCAKTKKTKTETERSFGKSWHHTVRRITDGWSLMVGLGININAERGGKRKRLISTENIT